MLERTPQEKDNIRVNDLTIVSEDEVKARIRGMLKECSQMNQVIAQENLRGYKTYIEETERSMRDLAKTEANYEKIMHYEQFIESCQNVGKKYDMQMNEIAERYVEEASQNYDKTVGRIGKMFSSIQDSRLTVRNKELYQQWSTRFDQVTLQLKSTVANMDKGGSAIPAFGNEQKEPVEKIIKKTKNRYARKKRMPIYMALLFLVLCIAGIIALYSLSKEVGNEIANGIEEVATQIQNTEITETEAETLLNTLHENSETAKDTLNNWKDVGKEICKFVNKFLEKTGLGSIIGLIGSFFGFIVIILGVLWYLWVKNLNKKQKAEICAKTKTHLNAQLDTFWQEKRLEKKVDECYGEIVNTVANAYEQILEDIFGTLI